MDAGRRYTVDELERMTPAELQDLRDDQRVMTVDDLSEPFRSKVLETMDRIDEIRPRRSEA